MARSTAKSTTKSTTKSTAKSTAKSTTPKKRAAANVPQQALAKVSLTLTDLPEKPKESWSLRETVDQLQDSISLAMERGYTYDEIVKVLANCDIHITASSLKRYLSIAKRSSTAKPRRNSAAASSEVQSSGTQAAATAEPLVEMAPRRRGRAASATKTAAKAKAAPRTTSRKRSQ